MSVRNKRTGLPVESNNETAARSQGLAAEGDIEIHSRYLADHWELIAAISWREYLAHGRGALLFQVSPETDGDWDCIYLPERAIQVNPLMGIEAGLIKECDPETEVVAIFLTAPASVISYRGSLSPDRIGPRQAYEKLSSVLNRLVSGSMACDKAGTSAPQCFYFPDHDL